MNRWLVLDVDGVVLDADRGGDGHWTNELERRFGIDRASLRATFFAPHWDDVVTGRRPIEPLLAAALNRLGSTVTVDDVLTCWFDADFFPVPEVLDLARRAHSTGVRIALATNQEPRRARYLRDHLGASFEIDAMITSAEVGAGKPDPAFFVAADLRIGRRHDTSIVFVDDTGANVEAAQRHGWQALHADGGGTWLRQVESLLSRTGEAS